MVWNKHSLLVTLDHFLITFLSVFGRFSAFYKIIYHFSPSWNSLLISISTFAIFQELLKFKFFSFLLHHVWNIVIFTNGHQRFNYLRKTVYDEPVFVCCPLSKFVSTPYSVKICTLLKDPHFGPAKLISSHFYSSQFGEFWLINAYFILFWQS